jgi:hypothetical protein
LISARLAGAGRRAVRTTGTKPHRASGGAPRPRQVIDLSSCSVRFRRHVAARLLAQRAGVRGDCVSRDRAP